MFFQGGLKRQALRTHEDLFVRISGAALAEAEARSLSPVSGAVRQSASGRHLVAHADVRGCAKGTFPVREAPSILNSALGCITLGISQILVLLGALS